MGPYRAAACLCDACSVWSIASGECLHALQGHTDSVVALLLTLDGGTLVSSSNDTTLRYAHVHACAHMHTNRQAQHFLQRMHAAVRLPAWPRVRAGMQCLRPTCLLCCSGHPPVQPLKPPNMQPQIGTAWRIGLSGSGAAYPVKPSTRALELPHGCPFRRVWSVPDGVCLHVLTAHPDKCSTMLALSGDERVLAAAAEHCVW